MNRITLIAALLVTAVAPSPANATAATQASAGDYFCTPNNGQGYTCCTVNMCYRYSPSGGVIRISGK